LFLQLAVESGPVRKSSRSSSSSRLSLPKQLEGHLSLVDSKLRSSAGRIEALLKPKSSTYEDIPKRVSIPSVEVKPRPQSGVEDAKAREVEEQSKLDLNSCFEESVLIHLQLEPEKCTHEQILVSSLREEDKAKVLAELLKRSNSRVCIDAMKFLEKEGEKKREEFKLKKKKEKKKLCFFLLKYSLDLNWSDFDSLPLLPAKPPPTANRVLYKNYMRLKFEYSDNFSTRYYKLNFLINFESNGI
jgi:hypothetical protein